MEILVITVSAGQMSDQTLHQSPTTPKCHDRVEGEEDTRLSLAGHSSKGDKIPVLSATLANTGAR